ncbi:FAM172 family protein homolog CG10038-like [Scaptodrosophila lebanonensis]|uniref:FAM172 family protein homolog CG10038-like n=1 Tax=Drosophila lebanonensis TaxID=7225 RepID=A0A6J2TEA6_DROLE|nr:FAM172 family protein homolog CG10038-like [Scaptodrosophila lebanonensis]
MFSRIFRAKREEKAIKKYNEALARLRQLKYAFNEAGQLRKVDENTGKPGDQPFEYQISGDRVENEDHYEKIGDEVTEIVYGLLEQNGLKRLTIPFHMPYNQSSFIFTQPAQPDCSNKLLVLIHGLGALPYIRRAQKLGYDIVVTNTNDNMRYFVGVYTSTDEVANPMQHANFVWEKIVMASKPQSVAIIAHSYGGHLAMFLSRQHQEFFKEKVFAIALTDSAHYDVPKDSREYLQKVTCNWASSEEPLDTVLPIPDDEVHKVSAGHANHEWTSYTAMESVMKYIEEKHEEHLRKVANV